MIVYAGSLRVDAEQRDRYVELRHEQIERARLKPGVLHYAICPDPIEPDLVQIFECYADEESLAAHVAQHERNGEIPVRAMEVYRYESIGRSKLTL